MSSINIYYPQPLLNKMQEVAKTDFGNDPKNLIKAAVKQYLLLRETVAYLQTLAEQGFIDVEPKERGCDLTEFYEFLVISGIAKKPEKNKFWLQLLNEDACLMLIKILKKEIET